jgi:hypothetical protein
MVRDTNSKAAFRGAMMRVSPEIDIHQSKEIEVWML